MEEAFDNLANSVPTEPGDDQQQQFIDDQLELNYLGGDLSADLSDDFKAKSPRGTSPTNGDDNANKSESNSQTHREHSGEGASSRADAPSRSESTKELLPASREELSRDEFSRDNQLDYETDSSLRSGSNGLAYEGSSHRAADESSSKDDLSKGNEPSNGQTSTDDLQEQPPESDLANGCKSTEQTERQNGSSADDPALAGSAAPSKCSKEGKPARKEGSKSILIVHLLNGGRFECPVTSKSTGSDVFRQTCDYLILREHKYFGLTYRDAENVRIWVNPEKKICKQIKDNPNSLHFEVKFFPEPTDLKENITRFFLCLQIRNNMIEEKISCSDETYAILGSYLAQSELGSYDPAKHGEHYLDGFKFAPKPTPSLIERLAELHKERRGLTAPEAELAFLRNAKKLSIYGLDFYPAKDANEIDFTIGVCSSGLSVYKDSVCVETLPWNKIVKVCYNCEHFSIKVKPADDKAEAENSVSFKLCSPKAAYGLWRITVAHHTFFKQLSANPPSKKSSKKSSKSSKHHRSKEEKSSSRHHHKKAKSKKESGSSKVIANSKQTLKSSLSSGKADSKRAKGEDRQRPKEDVSTDVRGSRKENNGNSENSKERHSSSRTKRRREEAKSSNYREEKLSYREEKLSYREEKLSYRDERSGYRDSSRDRKRVKIDDTRKESGRREEREKEYRRESRKEHHPPGREKRGDYRDEDRRDYREIERREPREETTRRDYREETNRRDYREETNRRDYREETRRDYRDEEERHYTSRSQREKSPPKSKRHKHKHSKNESAGEPVKSRRHPISIAESHYQSLAKESLNYLNAEKIKAREEKKHKHKSTRKGDEKRSPTDEHSPNEENSKKTANHFAKEAASSNDEMAVDGKDAVSNPPNEKISCSTNKEATSSSQSKPGSPPKKDVKLSSKSNVEFDIFWDGAENESVRSSDESKEMKETKESSAKQQALNKSKDDSLVSNDGEKRFIPRVLLNGNDLSGSIPVNSTGRVFTKFEIKSTTRTGPKTPPDDFNMFDNSTLSNQSIPTPTQDESQPGLNEKFGGEKFGGEKFGNEKFDNSLADSSNANSVRSLSPRSMQSDTPLINSDNNLSSSANKNSLNQSSSLNLSALNNTNNPSASLNLSSLNPISNSGGGGGGHHSAAKLNTKLNTSKSSKYEIYDPEAPLESPEQQAPSNNSLYPSNSYGLKSGGFNLFNSSSTAKTANGNNEMEIDSPFSPSKPINSPIISQPKASTSSAAGPQQPLPQFTGPELKLVLDHLIKAAQLQQKKSGEHSASPFRKQQQQPSKLIACGFGASDDDLPSSAVELNSREKYIKKLNRQERVVDEMKCSLKPYYQRKEINKEEYKSIMRKAVPKICHSKTGEINPIKIKKLVENYVSKLKRDRSRL